MKRFDLSFEKLIGQPCWNVKRGHGSFLTLEFGEPHLEIREPITTTSTSQKVHDNLARRQVRVHGSWHLWLYCCQWQVGNAAGKLVGDSSSARAIERAVKFLDGQALVASTLIPRGMRTLWQFALGATKSYSRKDEQWRLFEPGGKVLTVRADKRYSYREGDDPAEETWWPIEAEPA